jgi:hypothetical protein
VHTCTSTTQEDEAAGSGVGGQLGFHNETLSQQKKKSFLRKKKKDKKIYVHTKICT